MADRYFENFMQDFIVESIVERTDQEEEEGSVRSEKDLLLKLFSMPYSTLSARLTRAASDLKETIVEKTWRFNHENVQNFSLYSDVLGTAFLLLKSFQVTGNRYDLKLSSQIIKACDSTSTRSRDITILWGGAGVCALGAVVAKKENKQMLEYYVTQFKRIEVNKDHPTELSYGRAGYLWAYLFLYKNLSREIFRLGRLMNVLLEIKCTLMYVIKNKFPSGNYPSCEEDMIIDNLVHWCRGAPRMALTFLKAAEVFEDKEFVKAAIDAAEVVWKRGLLIRVGLCHGISGNAYVFLSLFRLTRNVKYLNRATAFACFLLDKGEKLILERKMHGGDNPYSLFEGIGGMAYLWS